MNRKKLRKLYEEYDYESIYDKQIKSLEEYENLRLNSEYVYVIKTIKAGSMIEKELYCIPKGRDYKRSMKKRKSSKAQEKLNKKNRIKNTIRLVNANFKQGDLYITLTYKKATLVNEDRAKKDIDNYIKKLKRWFKKNRPNEEFKYIHVIDFVDDPKKSKRTRIHHHLIVSEMDRDVAEEKWDLGVVNAKRLQPNEFQFEEVATYMAAQAKRRIGHSKNLKKPTITIDSTSLTRRKVERLAIEEYSHKEFFEKKNKNYKFLKSDTYISDDFGGVYIYAKMSRKENGRE